MMSVSNLSSDDTQVFVAVQDKKICLRRVCYGK
jgi:hypothetical protein